MSIFISQRTLINLSSSLINSLFFSIRIRLMILWNCIHIFTHICTENGSTISNISNVNYFINYKQYKSTASTPLYWILWLSKIQKLLFSFLETKFQCLNGFMRKVPIFCNLHKKLITYLCIFSFKKSEHLLPPCPSNTPK